MTGRLTAVFFLWMFLLVQCGGDARLTGNTSEIGNPKVVGYVFTPGGAAAGGATITVVPANHDPSAPPETSLRTGVADNNGAYCVAVPGPACYNLYGEQGRLGVLVDSLDVPPSATVSAPDAFMDTVGAVSGHVALDGSTRNQSVRVYARGGAWMTRTALGGYYLREGVPPGAYELWFQPDGRDEYAARCTTVTIWPGDTTVLDTFVLYRR